MSILDDLEVAVGLKDSPAVDAVNSAPLADGYGAGNGTPEEWAAWIERVFPGQGLHSIAYRAQAPVVAQAAGVTPNSGGMYSLTIHPNLKTADAIAAGLTLGILDATTVKVAVCTYPSGQVVMQPDLVSEGFDLTLKGISDSYTDDLLVLYKGSDLTFDVVPHPNDYKPPVQPSTGDQIADLLNKVKKPVEGILGNIELIIFLALLIYFLFVLNESGQLKKKAA